MAKGGPVNDSAGWSWATYAALLSFMAMGGGIVALTPELHRFAVETHGWVTEQQFATSFTLAQASPGPNMLFVTLIGWQIAGWKGALAATFALLLPTLTTTMAALRFSRRINPNSRFSRAVREGVGPLAIGLFLSTGWVLFQSAGHDWRGLLVVVLTVAILLRTKLNPIWAVAIGALIGGLGLI